jgi:hypothetical protein
VVMAATLTLTGGVVEVIHGVALVRLSAMRR